MTSSAYDVAVVGLGAVGSAALLALARNGVRAIGIDRFSPPHSLGSSHGDTRIMRQAIGEGEAYVPLVLRSNILLEELERRRGERLIERCGFIFITQDDANTSHHGRLGFLASTVAVARRFEIPHEILASDELSRRFPQFTGLSGIEQAYYEPSGGYIRPERCIAAFLDEARRLGAALELGRRLINAQPQAH